MFSRLKRKSRGSAGQDQAAPRYFPPGHFYSPYPDLADIRHRQEQIFSTDREICDVDLNEQEQLATLERIAEIYPTIPFPRQHQADFRYHYENPAYSYGDAMVLHSMIRLVEPDRIIEVGSGYSSAAILDTNDRFFDGQIDCCFVEPYPQLLKKLTGKLGLGTAEIVPKNLQNVDLSVFERLQAGDILVIDSTHVCKVNSDTNLLFFQVLPQLASGVVIHFHDIFYPFEYPKKWIYEGRAWHEAYLLQAFLTNNDRYEIIYWQNMMMVKHRQYIEQRMPDFLKNGGGNFWMRKR